MVSKARLLTVAQSVEQLGSNVRSWTEQLTRGAIAPTGITGIRAVQSRPGHDAAATSSRSTTTAAPASWISSHSTAGQASPAGQEWNGVMHTALFHRLREILAVL